MLSLQHRLLLAKVLEDNRVLGRRRVESFKLGRSLEEVAHVFNTYCANINQVRVRVRLTLTRTLTVTVTLTLALALTLTNINQASVDAGLDAWRGVDCAQFVRNVGLPQYDLTFERNLVRVRVRVRVRVSVIGEP